MNDVAQHRCSGAITQTDGFVGAVAAHEIEHSGSADRRLLARGARGKAGPAEWNLGAVVFHGHDDAVGIEVLGVKVRFCAAVPAFCLRMQLAVRTDRVVAELLSLLDQQVGLQRCAVVLTGDHGVKQIPQIAAQARLDGAHLEIVRLTEALEAELVEKVGPLEEGKKYILGIQAPWLWLDFAFRDWDVEKQVQVLDTAADFLSSVEGISAVFTAADLEQAPPPADDVPAWLAWRSYCPGRSGQIYIHLDAFWYEADEDGATGHGTGHSEDRHVPLLLAGPGVKPGRYAQSADLLDIAPTLAMMFGIEPPNDACGRVLHEAFVP